MDIVTLAVIGAGLMGAKHAELITTNDQCSLIGICDCDNSRKSVAEQYGVPFFQRVETMLDTERPDGVIIATPSASHADIAELCAKRSVHSLVEKPIAGTIDEAYRIHQAGIDYGVHILIGHHRRYNPLIQKAQSIIKNGGIGNMVAVSVLWALYKPDEYYRLPWRCHRPDGGLTLINLIHDLDSLRYICGEIESVFCRSSTSQRNLEVEDTASITLVFRNGALGTVLASDTTPSPWSYEATTKENPLYFHTDENCYHFFGTRGSLAFPQLEVWRYPDSAHMGWQHRLEKERHTVDSSAGALEAQLEHFCRVIRGLETPAIVPSDGIGSLEVALAVLESARRQSPVELPPS